MIRDVAALRPRLRGVSHRIAFHVALVAGAVLVLAAHERIVCAIYATSLALMFGVSATLHRATRRNAWLRRADHAAIFICIAGTYTPFSLLGLGGDAGRHMLVVAWVANLAGVVRALAWPNAPRVVTSACYVAAGWVALGYLPELRAALDPVTFAAIFSGGVAFTIGALVYLTRWPDPWPRVFGYHEVFHALTIIGCACHFIAVARLL